MEKKTVLCSCTCPCWGDPDTMDIYQCVCTCGTTMNVCGLCLVEGRWYACPECQRDIQDLKVLSGQ